MTKQILLLFLLSSSVLLAQDYSVMITTNKTPSAFLPNHAARHAPGGADTLTSHYATNAPSDGTTYGMKDGDWTEVTGGGSSDDLQYNGTTTPDYSTHYLGYPKLTLTTNMVSSSQSGGTRITLDSFANAFDLDFTTGTSTGAMNNHAHSYMIDLGANYSGFISIYYVFQHGAVNNFMNIAQGGVGVAIASGTASRANYSRAQDGFQYFINISRTTTNQAIIPFHGSKIVNMWSSGAAASTYRIVDFSVWGVTNGYNAWTGDLP